MWKETALCHWGVLLLFAPGLEQLVLCNTSQVPGLPGGQLLVPPPFCFSLAFVSGLSTQPCSVEPLAPSDGAVGLSITFAVRGVSYHEPTLGNP